MDSRFGTPLLPSKSLCLKIIMKNYERQLNIDQNFNEFLAMPIKKPLKN